MRVVAGWAENVDVDRFLAWLASVGDEHGAAVQAFDARYVAGRAHLEAAVDRANRAFDRDDAIADDRAIEILCYAAGRRQIDRAMEIGVDRGRHPVAVVIDGGDEAAAAAAVGDRIDETDVIGHARDEGMIADYFHITERERRATTAGLEALVIERVSLLAVDK